MEMTLKSVPIERVEEAHLISLVEDEVTESRAIEYKAELPGSKDSEKKEFLADVCSFANASGGDIVYGIEEECGSPMSLHGVASENPDAEILRLDNLVRDGLDPRPRGLRIRAVPLAGGRHVIVVRMPESVNGPHVVDHKGHWRFYSRNSAGKYQMDLSEVRTAFGVSGATAERAKNFRTDRLAAVIAGETPVPLDDRAAKIALHLVPWGAFDPSARFDVRLLSPEIGLLQPIYGGGKRRYNFDGILDYGEDPRSTSQESLSSGYVQVFCNGIVEYVDADFLHPRETGLVIPSVTFEERLLNAAARGFLIQEKIGVDPPAFVMLSLLGVSGYRVGYGESARDESEVARIDRGTLVVPEVLAEAYPDNALGVQRLMRSAFDAVWNAAGWGGSKNYGREGVWSPRSA